MSWTRKQGCSLSWSKEKEALSFPMEIRLSDRMICWCFVGKNTQNRRMGKFHVLFCFLDVRIPDGRQRAAVGKKKSGSDHIFGLLRWDSQGEPFVPESGDDVRYPDESLPVKIPLLFLQYGRKGVQLWRPASLLYRFWKCSCARL